MTSLLPPNSTDLERKFAEAGKDAFDLPSIRIIKDIDQRSFYHLSHGKSQSTIGMRTGKKR